MQSNALIRQIVFSQSKQSHKFMPKKIADTATPSSFENAMAELNALVSQMESGQLPLEASVTAYQRGSELIQYCAAQLEKVEQQVKVLDAGMLKSFQVEEGQE